MAGYAVLVALGIAKKMRDCDYKVDWLKFVGSHRPKVDDVVVVMIDHVNCMTREDVEVDADRPQ